ncbi:hypothetical protein [Pyrobaculum aerophilum]|uniref:Uncharacterized protein n=1 Tax=Pyrobaculum aerophilum TaxID=13773 RepID=A0A371R6W8_9CREN|nr:hypothetical protein [Pyrobaculum aerophilum]RFA94623.1 hypothetical protein CGL51_09550 [Pyrobaculum aerophilum]RFB00287.1 hypothetical protein CGL52_01590 [Pyrobaculum aerophilum]
MKWSLYAVLYLIGVLTLGLLLMGFEQTVSAALDLVFLIIAIVLFRLALQDVSAALDIASEDRERWELRAIQILLVATFIIAASVLAYGLLKSLFPFIP